MKKLTYLGLVATFAVLVLMPISSFAQSEGSKGVTENSKVLPANYCPYGYAFDNGECKKLPAPDKEPIAPLESFKGVTTGDNSVTKPVNGICPDGYILNNGECDKPSITTKTPIAPSESSKDSSGGSFINSPINGQCSDGQLMSENGKECIKLDIKIQIAPKEDSKEQAGTTSSFSEKPINGVCPPGYEVDYAASDRYNKDCLKISNIPKITIAPKEGYKEVNFESDGKVTIKDSNTNKETVIAPKEGFKTVVSVESDTTEGKISKEVSIQSDASSTNTTISAGQVSASTNESVQVKDNKVFLKRAEVKIMPDTASESAIAKLGDLGFKIELKDVGNGNDVKPAYEATAEQDVKIFGIFSVKMAVSANVDAQTGTVSELNKPWWSFLAK